MALQTAFIPYTLDFKFDARTSRGLISQHQVYFIKLWHAPDPTIVGLGECAPLAGLSIDYRPDLLQKLENVCQTINAGKAETINPDKLELQEWPAIGFALETALLDLQNGGNRQIYKNAFSNGETGIPINGLVWMGDKDFMQQQISQKLAQGYSCLKLKIGGLDFTTELEILQSIRETASEKELTIRVDANGAFAPDEAFKKLERLAKYNIHSIEQPIKQGQWKAMEELCAYTPVPIALDEELIGVQAPDKQAELLETINPQYIILKPTLVGGLKASADWIELAEKRSIGWWMTSALESNIGLNAISQFTANYSLTMPQGLGTGQLYHNNIASPLQIEQGKLWYREKQEWGQL
ncbi:o-succinylbenzoate synthase [Pontibacter sp. BT310]|uniref:O-succinylbenzoate synthase n=1 Tax=Pontibacter populi TaxID=890055 RepID=A0ABS6XA72_9BACT|nr:MULTISPECIES: o-succinylbenzoate synthase [Pontibacter]MBJ6118045.1 o-succinylbenzoate synthase [Pontibacter sp. BT310]MBR0570472.1 o-succinylbenzoate synthase [Microvirga sp. STS03]MBW3364898.1 o-succinylbenzoate synthase [Pontibacter populi]